MVAKGLIIHWDLHHTAGLAFDREHQKWQVCNRCHVLFTQHDPFGGGKWKIKSSEPLSNLTLVQLVQSSTWYRAMPGLKWHECPASGVCRQFLDGTDAVDKP